MTVSNTNVLDLLGKQVSFVYPVACDSTVHSLDCTGTVTSIAINLNQPPFISIDDGDFYALSDLLEFNILK